MSLWVSNDEVLAASPIDLCSDCSVLMVNAYIGEQLINIETGDAVRVYRRVD